MDKLGRSIRLSFYTRTRTRTRLSKPLYFYTGHAVAPEQLQGPFDSCDDWEVGPGLPPTLATIGIQAPALLAAAPWRRYAS